MTTSEWILAGAAAVGAYIILTGKKVLQPAIKIGPTPSALSTTSPPPAPLTPVTVGNVTVAVAKPAGTSMIGGLGNMIGQATAQLNTAMSSMTPAQRAAQTAAASAQVASQTAAAEKNVAAYTAAHASNDVWSTIGGIAQIAGNAAASAVSTATGVDITGIAGNLMSGNIGGVLKSTGLSAVGAVASYVAPGSGGMVSAALGGLR